LDRAIRRHTVNGRNYIAHMYYDAMAEVLSDSVALPPEVWQWLLVTAREHYGGDVSVALTQLLREAMRRSARPAPVSEAAASGDLWAGLEEQVRRQRHGG
jgi:hypothetical protein